VKKNKVIAIIVCIFMLVTAVVGCSKDAKDQGAEPPGGGISAEGSHRHNEHGIDYELAFAAFAPDTIMINTGDLTVTWAELFFYLRGNINEVFAYLGGLPEWEEEIAQDSTFADFVLLNASADVLEARVIESGAAYIGVTLSEEDVQGIVEYFYSLTERFGGEEEFLRLIWEEDGCSSRELFDRLVGLSRLVDAIFYELYGENGELVSDDDIIDDVAGDEYLMAKHILRLHADDDDSDTARTEIEEIWGLLNDFEGDEFEAFFDELMFEYSEDSGLAMSPQGYLFQYGDMVREFYDAAVELDIGQFSEIVETSYGYHIIFRIPIDVDSVPSSGYITNDTRTLRERVMINIFNARLVSWRDEMEIEYTDAFESINLAEVFAPCGCEE